MKNILLLLIFIALYSCGSDNLSNSKAEDIITECLEKEPLQRSTSFTIKKATFGIKDHDLELLQKYLKLKEDGFIEMELIKEITKGWRKGYKEYSIKLNEKAMVYLNEVPENGQTAYAKTFRYEVEKVLEVQEKPSLNTAIVKVQFKAVDITPFSVFSPKDPTEFWIKDLKMTKTSNGWKYCDNF